MNSWSTRVDRSCQGGCGVDVAGPSRAVEGQSDRDLDCGKATNRPPGM